MKKYIIAFLLLSSLPIMAQTEILVDIDGNSYKTITINKQTWMAENLKTTRFNDGVPIPMVIDIKTWISLKQPAYCWYDDKEKPNKELYGALYNWYTVQTGKLCPQGWHVPSDKVWLAKAPNSVGFRDVNGIYYYSPSESYYWTSSEYSLSEAYCQSILFDESEVTRSFTSKTDGMSVRCIKDENK
jgi:hypothetical protein